VAHRKCVCREGQGEGETGKVEKLAWAMAESGPIPATPTNKYRGKLGNHKPIDEI